MYSTSGEVDHHTLVSECRKLDSLPQILRVREVDLTVQVQDQPAVAELPLDAGDRVAHDETGTAAGTRNLTVVPEEVDRAGSRSSAPA